MSGSDQNKSEQATPYKLAQARKKGMVARSPELGAVACLLCCVGYWWAYGPDVVSKLQDACFQTLSQAAWLGSDPQRLVHYTSLLFSHAARAIYVLIGGIVLAALCSGLAQTGFLFAPDALKADFSKLNPMQGLKRLFSKQVLIEGAKACVKMVAYAGVGYAVIRDEASTAMTALLSPREFARALEGSAVRLLFALLALAILFALIDQVIVRRAFAKRMRMSRRDQKDEVKQREGDPRIKAKRRQLQHALLQRSKNLRGVRGADLAIANPTHILVGLRYDLASASAPMVVAKGAGEFAQRLKKLAFLYGVPVIESPALARTLFRKAPTGQEIPEAFYKDVAALYVRARSAQASGGMVS